MDSPPAGKFLLRDEHSVFSRWSDKKKCATFLGPLATYDNKAAVVRTFFFPYSEVTLEDSALREGSGNSYKATSRHGLKGTG